MKNRKTKKSQKMNRMLIGVLLLSHVAMADGLSLEGGFAVPPAEARLHAYWWWLNGNVTKEAITRDLEAMKEKGFGGALITDAGGANQDGNLQVPAGPLFGSKAWRELYCHALREGARLNVEMALNIQSGWNLGGPSVTPEDAAKILCYTETIVEGPGPVTANLAAPQARNGLLREVAVVAVPDRAPQISVEVTASSAHKKYPVSHVSDNAIGTFWVSDGLAPGTNALAWIRVSFDCDREVNALSLTGIANHGPKELAVFAMNADGTKRLIAGGSIGPKGAWRATLKQPQTVRQLEFCVMDAYDTAPVNGKPRNVQVAEISVSGPGWQWPVSSNTDLIPGWDMKALYRAVGGANTAMSGLVPGKSSQSASAVIEPALVTDVSRFVDAKGTLTWTAPSGAWRVYRFCYTVSPAARVSTSSYGWGGLALDPMDAGAYQRYWDTVVEPLMADAKQIPKNTLKYLHTDSWEIEPFNWTEKLPEEFKKRCGYDLKPWLPVLARCAVSSTESSERFLSDFRKTVAALVAENHYGPFLKNAHRHGLQVRAESGGPHGVPIDAQHCLGIIDVPMSEFWATSWRHRVPDLARFFVKQPASAAHTYGKKIVAAEGFTTIGPHWQEKVWDNLKPNFDRALCEGLNQLVWTLLTCSPKEMGMPGQEMFPGTHFNPNSTWWQQSEGFLSYINRCQWMLRQGLFVGDVLYYYGDLAPNFAGLKALNPAGLPPGYDYDVASEYVLLNRVSVKAGRIVLPDNMSYGALVLPPHRTASLAVLRKLRELAAAGAILIGPRPDSSSGLMAWQKGDAETQELINHLWGKDSKKGLVKHDTAADWLKSSGLAPDFAIADRAITNAPLDYIHRQDEGTEIYFVANRQTAALRVDCLFRVKGKTPELWDPVTGTLRPLPTCQGTEDGRTKVSLAFEPLQSFFVIFRTSQVPRPKSERKNFPVLKPVQELTGPWNVQFDPAWFYSVGSQQPPSPRLQRPGEQSAIVFETLTDWTQRPEAAIKYYSGLATYRKIFDFAQVSTFNFSLSTLYLSLGTVREMARVRLNGHDLGVVWCPPWNVQIPDGALKEKENRLEIEVVNFWPNRLIGDAGLPPEQRRTRTNITKFYEPKGDKHYTTLMPSGLLGPVTIQKVVVE
jgi:hypothetical protein